MTCRRLPEPDPDEAPLLAALAERGVEAALVPWDDPAGPPPAGTHELYVLRSCWNYPEAPDAFLEWVERAADETPLWNPPEVVRWNLHKGYLLELADRGVPVVPTVFLEQGDATDLALVTHAHGWDDVVVKPAVSAASYRTARFGPSELEAGRNFLRDLLEVRDAMVQPYVRSVEHPGERALVWIDGETTHAVVKRPRFAGEDESVSEALAVSEEERELVDRVLQGWTDRLLYARLDVVAGDDGAPLVSELELLEPSLFLVQHPPALARLVDGIVARLGA